jgi:uncharacterized protein (UPF0261 family)
MATVVLLGTLDTKGAEYAFLRERVLAAGCDVLVVDAGVLGDADASGPCPVDITADEVARAAGEDRQSLVRRHDRGAAVAAMARGAAMVIGQLHEAGRLDAVLGMGGSGGTTIIAAAMQALPVGVPKLIVSTMASGDTRAYIGTTDIALLYSVIDIAGINVLAERILANAAAAVAGMARAAAGFRSALPRRPLVAATMFGVTTPCVTVAREWLEAHGYEVLVFHATGTGGRAMEGLIRSGFLAGVLDVTTTELADELVGGVLSAGPDRLEAAGTQGLPQVVSVGALDMCNFGPPETMPAAFAGRRIARHNPTVTLLRTTPDECAELGRTMARKLNAATGPVSVFLPLRGISAIDAPGEAFHDPAADAALFGALREGLRPPVDLVEVDAHINDPGFATAMAARLHGYLEGMAT